MSKTLDNIYLYATLLFRRKKLLYLISSPDVITAKKIAKKRNIEADQYRVVPIQPLEVRSQVIHDCQPVTENLLIGVFSVEEREILVRKNTRKDYNLEKSDDKIQLKINGIPIITVSEKGAFYKGQLIRDAGELHRRFSEYLDSVDSINKKQVKKKLTRIIDTIPSRSRKRRRVR